MVGKTLRGKSHGPGGEGRVGSRKGVPITSTHNRGVCEAQDAAAKNHNKKKVTNAQESNSTILLGMNHGSGDRNSSGSTDPAPSLSALSEMMRSGDLQAKTTALETLIRNHVNGETQNHQIMYVIKYLTPLSDHYIKKLVLYFFEVIDKTDEDGDLLSEVILICSFLRNDLEHPNEYIRGLTLRFLAKLQEKELIEPLISAVVQNVSHRVPYVRRNAALAIHAIYKKFPELLPDVVDVIEGALYTEGDVSTRRHLFDALVFASPERAAIFLEEYCATHDIAEAGSAFLQSVVEFARQRISLSVSEKAQYVPVLCAVLQSSSFVVRYDCASTLRRLSGSPSAITQAAQTYIDILRQYSDNTVRLIILSQLHQMKNRFADVLRSSSLLDVLSILHEEMGGLIEIRQSVWNLATHLVSAATVGSFVSAIRKELKHVRQEICDGVNQLLLSKSALGRGGCGGGGPLGGAVSASNTFGVSGTGGGALPSGSGGASAGGEGLSCSSAAPDASSQALVALEEYRMNLLKSLDSATQRFPQQVGELIVMWLPEFHFHHPALVRSNGGFGGKGSSGGGGDATAAESEGGGWSGNASDAAAVLAGTAGGGGGGSSNHNSPRNYYEDYLTNSSGTRMGEIGGEMEEKDLHKGSGGGGALEDRLECGGIDAGASHPFGRLAALSEAGNAEVMRILKRILLAQESAFHSQKRRVQNKISSISTADGNEEKEENDSGENVGERQGIMLEKRKISSSTAASLARLRLLFPQIGQSKVLRAAMWLLGAFSPSDPSTAAATPQFFGLSAERGSRLRALGARGGDGGPAGGGSVGMPVFASPEEEEEEKNRSEEDKTSDSGTMRRANVLRGAAAALALLRQELGLFPLSPPKKTMNESVEEMILNVGGGGMGSTSGGGGGGGYTSTTAGAGGMHAVTTVLEDGTYGMTYVPITAFPHEDEGGNGKVEGAGGSGVMGGACAGGGVSSTSLGESGAVDSSGMLLESNTRAEGRGGNVGNGGGGYYPYANAAAFSSTRSFLRSMVVEGDGFLISTLASTIVRLVQIQEGSGNPVAGLVAREVGVEMLREILRYGETAVQREPYIHSIVSLRSVPGRGGGVEEKSLTGGLGGGGGILLFDDDTEEQLRMSMAMLSLPAGLKPDSTSVFGGETEVKGKEKDGAMTAVSPGYPLMQETLQTSLQFLTPAAPLSFSDSSPLFLTGGMGVMPGRREREEEEAGRGESKSSSGAAGEGGGRGEPPRLLDAFLFPEKTQKSKAWSQIAMSRPALMAMWGKSMNTPLFFSSLSGGADGEGEDDFLDEEREIQNDEDGEMEERRETRGSGGGEGVVRGVYQKEADYQAMVWSSMSSSASTNASPWKQGGGSGAAASVGGVLGSISSSSFPAPAPLPSFAEATCAHLRRLEEVVPLSGANDPIYCECSVRVHEFHLTVHFRLVNCTSSPLFQITIDLISLGGIKLCERPQAITLQPFEQMTMSTSLRVDGTESGVIFGYLVFVDRERTPGCLVLKNIEVDILNYVHPVIEMAEDEFRRKWRVSEWENRIVISTTVAAVQEESRRRLAGRRGGSNEQFSTTTTAAAGRGEKGFLSFSSGTEGGAGREETTADEEEMNRYSPSAAASSLELYISLVAQSLNVGRITTESEEQKERVAQLLGIVGSFPFSTTGDGDELVQLSLTGERMENDQVPVVDGQGGHEGHDQRASFVIGGGGAAASSRSSSPGLRGKEVMGGSCGSCNLAARTTFNEDVLVHISVECDSSGRTASLNGGTIRGIVRIRSTTHAVAYGVGKKLNALHSQLTLLQGQEI